MPRLDDVARVAGVSKTTVSRVLNNRGYISDETRTSVYNAVKALNYYPNRAARSLLKQCSRVVGLLVPDIRYPLFAQLAQQIEYELMKQDYRLLVLNSCNLNELSLDGIEQFRHSNVDGLILCNYRGIIIPSELKIPVVSVDRNMTQGISTISSDHHTGGRLAAELLLRNGCTCVLQTVGSDYQKTPWIERHVVFEDTLKSAGVICHTHYRDSLRVADYEYNCEVIREQLAKHPDVDGYFGPDVSCVAMLKEAVALGKRVPEDVQIISCDGTDLTKMSTPAITAIRQPADRIAKWAAETICMLIDDPTVDTCDVQMKVELVERDTTKRLGERERQPMEG